MADDPTQRTYRSGDRPARASTGGSDPLAELARLIGQNDPFGEYGRDQARSTAGSTVVPRASAPAAAEWQAAPPPPPAPPRQAQVAAYRDEAPYQAPPAPFEHGLEDPSLAAYDSEQEDFYEDDAPRRRTGVVVIGAIFALAVIGTAGAFGYRALFGTHGTSVPPVIKSDPAPIKVQPPKQDAKLIQERAPAPLGEKLAPPHEEPIELKDKPAGVIAPAPPQGTGLVGSEPKKIHTITIRPDMTVANAAPAAPAAPNAAPAAAPPAAAAVPEPAPRPAPQPRVAAAPGDGNAPLSLNPNAQPAAPAARPAAPVRTAAVPPPARATAPAAHNAATGGFAVQLSARRSEAEAQAAFHSLQAKFPSQLGGHQPLIRKVEINGKGTYYRTMVGPFGSSEEAAKLCSALKAAGGSCFVQRI